MRSARDRDCSRCERVFGVGHDPKVLSTGRPRFKLRVGGGMRTLPHLRHLIPQRWSVPWRTSASGRPPKCVSDSAPRSGRGWTCGRAAARVRRRQSGVSPAHWDRWPTRSTRSDVGGSDALMRDVLPVACLRIGRCRGADRESGFRAAASVGPLSAPVASARARSCSASSGRPYNSCWPLSSSGC